MIKQAKPTLHRVTKTVVKTGTTKTATTTATTDACQPRAAKRDAKRVAKAMRYAHLMFITSVGCLTVTGCQSLTSASTTSHAALSTLSAEQAKLRLTDTLYHSLRRNQTWVSEHQLYLLAPTPHNNDQTVQKPDDIVDCQTTHDNALVAQLTADGLASFAAVATLHDAARAPYTQIKTQYLRCYDTATKNSLPANLMALASDADTNDTTDSTEDTATHDPLSVLQNRMSLFGLSDGQITSLNNFATKSGKITTTGVYRPLSGLLALQFDAGFENKNLAYHYRMPLVLNTKNQAVYIKPDVIMPNVALYLDNKLGMTWQPLWYKFTAQTASPHLPMDVALKQWLMAIHAGLTDLPASQFQQVSLRQFTQTLAHDTAKNLSAADKAQRLQAIPHNSTIIHWQQSAKEQDNWHQDVLERFIQGMDMVMSTHYANRADYQRAWQRVRQKLSRKLENRLVSEPSPDQRLHGKSLYIVMSGNTLEQIWGSHRAIYQQQPVQINTWVTFGPHARLLANANQPQTLLTLAGTIRDNPSTNNAQASGARQPDGSNVIDGRAELKRLLGLDDSRRLFGQPPVWLSWLDALVNPRAADDVTDERDKSQP